MYEFTTCQRVHSIGCAGTSFAYASAFGLFPNGRAAKPPSFSGCFCLMMSASIVTPRWFACEVRSAETWKSFSFVLNAGFLR